MTEQEYKQTLNLIENSVFANMPLQWVETFQPGIGQMIANIEREVTEWADLNAPVWAVDPLQSGTYNAVKSELLAFAQNLQKYKDDPTRSEVIYDFVNAARSLYSFNKNYGLDRTPLTNAENPFKLSVISSRVTLFGYMHFKSLSNLVKFNEDLLSSIVDEKIQLKGYTKTVLEPVREKLYKLITEDPEFKNLLDELGFGEVDDFIQSFTPNTGTLESLSDEFFSNFNTFVGNISARLDTERQTTDLAIADARADAQESINDALGRVDQLVADLSTYQTGINTQIQTIESAYESLNTTVQSNVSRIGATESAIIQEATTRADGFTATAARIDGMVSRIDVVDASILQESNTRASEDAAIADRIDQLVTRVDNNAAAIINEQDARTTAILAEATARQTLAAQLKSDSELYASGLVTTESNVRAAQDQVLGERIDLVSAEVGGISTAILDEQTARITGDEAEATSRKALSTKLFGTDVIDGVTVDTLTSGFLYDQQQSIITQTESVVTAATGQIAQIQTDLTNTRADLLTETTTRVNEYGAISTSVTALSTQVNNQNATLDSLNAVINGTDGITTQWGIKSDINGYITGVGLISSSKYGTPTSQFIVYADQFALVTPGVNGGQPTLPFFVGSEQGYLELSNTVKSNWNNITGSNKPADNATRNVFRGDWVTSTSYAVGDIVLQNGNGWSCVVAHTSSGANQPPASGSGNAWWAAYTVKGGDGKAGLNFSDAKLLTTDPTFQSGISAVALYNNSGNGTVTLTREAKQADSPFGDSAYNLRISNTGTSSPYLGGFTFITPSRANAQFVARIIAKLPVGYELTWHSNPVGTNSESRWLSSSAGTGRFEEYLYFVRCGSEGPFSTTNFFALSGPAFGTPGAPINWYLAYAAVYDFTALGLFVDVAAAAAAANAANATLADIAADNKLTAVEKQSAANEWGIINRERTSIRTQADALGISYELWDYDYVYAVLNDYITPLLQDISSTSVIDGATFRDKWSYFYEYRQRLINRMAAVAATKADWSNVTGSGRPENGATVGADSSNLKSGPGVNMVFNGDYTDGLAGTTVGWRSGGNQHILDWNRTSYTVQGEGTACIMQPGTPNAGVVFDAYVWNGKEGNYFAVTPGKRYEVSAWLNCHRSVGVIGALFYDAAGTQLHFLTGNEVTHQSTITSIADMQQSWVIGTAPATAVKALLIVRASSIGAVEPYVFFSRVYFGEAGAGQTEPSLWTPGRGISQITTSNVSTYIANAAIGAAQIGSIELVGESAFKVRTNNSAGARMDMDSRRIKIFDASGALRVQLGDLTV